jgi:putative FmdB family regulatory protein
MPIHDYRCKDCGHVAEMLIRTNAEEETPACPACGSTRLERLISAPHIARTTSEAAPRCGKGSTCCGSSTPCEKPPCS